MPPTIGAFYTKGAGRRASPQRDCPIPFIY
jgi:hypothetical protein